MAATVGGAFKQMIEAAGLGVPVYREAVPVNAPLPYAVVFENIATLSQPSGHSDTERRIVETIQIDLWQHRDAENYALRDKLTALLLMQRPGKAGTSPIRQVRVASSNRAPSLDDTVRGHSWTVDVWRAVS